MSRVLNRSHRKHMRDVKAWHRTTGGEDWRLIKVRKYLDKPWRFLYEWAGPDGTHSYRLLLGPEQSAWFLAAIKAALRGFRLELARHLHQPAIDGVPAPVLRSARQLPDLTQPAPPTRPTPDPFLPPVVAGEVIMDEEELEGLDHSV